MSIRETVIAQVVQVAERQRKTLARLTDELPLLESGLDSLCLAVVVVSLDDELGLDPFAGEHPVSMPITLGDFIRLYEHAAAA